MINEELQQQIEQLASTLDWIKTKLFDLQEEKGLAPVKTPYEVEVPDDIDDYVYINNFGRIFDSNGFTVAGFEKIYKRGLIFKTVKEVEQYDQERILLFKMHKWAEKHNGEWEHELGSSDCRYCIVLRFILGEGFVLSTEENGYFDPISKLPYFKSEKIAKQFIEEFGEEIKEVLC